MERVWHIMLITNKKKVKIPPTNFQIKLHLDLSQVIE